MNERLQLNVRMDSTLLADLDELAEGERLDRTELARQLLREGIERRRLDRAVREYREGRVSSARAAEIARVSLYEMLDRIHAEHIPQYELEPEEVRRLRGPGEHAIPTHAVGESAAAYGEIGSDAESGIDALREQFRPASVRTLFIGESSPAGGTHFYRANSNLFRATREAFADATEPGSVPTGAAFLRWFADRGCWLVDVVDSPVNRMVGRPRKDAVDAGTERLAAVIRETGPQRIVVIKATIAPTVRRAASLAGFEGPILELPFPVRQWRSLYIRQLAAAVGEDPPEAPPPRQRARRKPSS